MFLINIGPQRLGGETDKYIANGKHNLFMILIARSISFDPETIGRGIPVNKTYSI